MNGGDGEEAENRVGRSDGTGFRVRVYKGAGPTTATRERLEVERLATRHVYFHCNKMTRCDAYKYARTCQAKVIPLTLTHCGKRSTTNA